MSLSYSRQFADLQNAPFEAAKAPLQVAARSLEGSSEGLSNFDMLQSNDQSVPLCVVTTLKRALKLAQTEQYFKALALCGKTLDEFEDLSIVNHVTAIVLDRMGRYSLAISFYERALRSDAHNPTLLVNIGITAWRLNLLKSAEIFFRLCIKLMPHDHFALINLVGILRERKCLYEAKILLTSEIEKNPEKSLLWNALGSILSDSGDDERAIVFYNEALRLEPELVLAKQNIAVSFGRLGKHVDALRHFDSALEMMTHQNHIPGDRATIRVSRALTLLALGRLEEGWREYQARMDPSYPKATLFSIQVPYWDGADAASLRNQSLLLIGEQGLGDEVKFISCLPDIMASVGAEGSILIACDERLVTILGRSFPGVYFVPHKTIKMDGRLIRTLDHSVIEEFNPSLWAPLGNGMRAFRSAVDKFPNSIQYLFPDDQKVANWRSWLQTLGGGVNVGLLWRSMHQQAGNLDRSLVLEDWISYLGRDDLCFINMQYGSSEIEIMKLKEKHCIQMHQPPGVNLKDDMENVAALGKAMDMVLGPMNASMNLFCACGVEAIVIEKRKRPWTSFGTEKRPIYPGAKSIDENNLINHSLFSKFSRKG